MGNQTPRNYLSDQDTAIAASYTEFSYAPESYFSIYSPDGAIWLSIGRDAPADVTSVLVPMGGTFSLDTGVVGKIAYKAVSADVTVYTVYA